MEYITRNLEEKLSEMIETRPLTYLNGARQVGKSTICSNIKKEHNYITFDSPLILASAKNNPEDFVNSLQDNVLNIIDEVQSVPEIFPYLKMKIDKNRLNGTNQSFLLTGSANLMALPTLSETLVGRMSILTLFPFSASEYFKTNISLIDKLFNSSPIISSLEPINILNIIEMATFPEIALNKNIDRISWFDSYLTTILNKDIKSLSDLKNPTKIVMLLTILAMKTGGLINNTEVAKEVGIDYRTYKKMLAFAINSFMIFMVKPWSKPNKLGKRFIKSPKLYFTDCNFLSYLLKRNIKTIYDSDKITFGHIFENFIATELIKTAKIHNVEISHYRTLSGKETDFVLENTNGDVVGIEVKSSNSIDKKYGSGLLELKEVCEEKFKYGYIIYTGTEIVPVSDKIWAIPVNYLWT